MLIRYCEILGGDMPLSYETKRDWVLDNFLLDHDTGQVFVITPRGVWMREPNQCLQIIYKPEWQPATTLRYYYKGYTIKLPEIMDILSNKPI
jgi:hypothetical protein